MLFTSRKSTHTTKNRLKMGRLPQGTLRPDTNPEAPNQKNAMNPLFADEFGPATALPPEQFAAVSFLVNRYLMDHMRRLVRELDADFDQMYLWGLVSHMQLLKTQFQQPDQNNPAQGAKLSELTQISGLPRETVRRKLKQLASNGRIHQTDDGRWVLDTRCLDDKLIRFTLDTIHRLRETAAALENVLAGNQHHASE